MARGYEARSWAGRCWFVEVVACLAMLLMLSALTGCGGDVGADKSVGTTASAVTGNGAPMAPGPSLGTFAVFASRTVRVGPETVITGGNVGAASANLPSSAASHAVEVLAGAQIDQGKGVYGKAVLLSGGAAIGAVHTDQLINLGGTHGTVGPMVQLPEMGDGDGPTHDGIVFVVPAGSSMDVPPGEYSVIQVGAKATARLMGGLYETGRLILEEKSRVFAAAPVEIHVSDSYRADEKSRLGPDEATALTAESVHLAVLGQDGATYAADFGEKTETRALIRVPSGTLNAGEKARFIGVIAARDALFGNKVRVIKEDTLLSWPLQPGNGGQVAGCVSPACSTSVPCKQSLDVCCGFCFPAACSEVFNAQDGSACSDGNVCTVEDACENGVCAGKADPINDDGNPCTDDACDPVTGVATHTNKPSGTLCDNDDLCDGEDTCNGNGVCVPGPAPAFPPATSDCDFVFCNPLTKVTTTKTCPELDRTVVTPPSSAASFLYEDLPNPIQSGVAAGTLIGTRVAVIRGKVKVRGEGPLPNVEVAVLGQSGLGKTKTTVYGTYALAVNGGGPVVLRFEKAGYLPAQRAVPTTWQGYARAPDVAMVRRGPVMTNTAFPPVATKLQLGATSAQALLGPVETDASGSRQVVLLVPAGVQAKVDGKDATVPLTVRATEYSVGNDGPSAMPSLLPPNSGYTFATELAADEGARVEFNTPLFMYVKSVVNGMQPGMTVPLGAYDPNNAQWVAEESGVVVKILSESGGVAQVEPATVQLFPGEGALLAQVFDPEDVLWRVPVPHFSTWDPNWPFGVPPSAKPPPGPNPAADKPPNGGCTVTSSTIECQGQILGEDVPIAGTPYSLHYRSDRVPGRIAARTLSIPLRGATVPTDLERIEVTAIVAGKVYSHQVAATASVSGEKFEFTWDGKNALGQTMQGSQPVHVDVGYVYKGVYQQTATFGSNGNGTEITGSITRQEVTLHRRWEGRMGGWDALPQGFGGWTLSAQHAYDPFGAILHRGDGTRQDVRPPAMERVASLASQSGISASRGIATAPDGAVYVAHPSAVLRVAPSGAITVFAGSQTQNGFVDNTGAATARFADIRDLAVAPDGAIYVADRSNGRVRVVRGGQVTTLAGSGFSVASAGVDGELATETTVKLGGVERVTVGIDGTVYIAEQSGNRVRRIGTDGRIYAVAGIVGQSSGPLNDGDVATEVAIGSPNGLAVGSDGTVYVSHQNVSGSNNSFVRAVGTDGRIRTVAGNSQVGTGAVTDGIAAAPNPTATPPVAGVPLFRIWDLETGVDGSIYISQQFSGAARSLVRRVDPSGTIWTVAGDPQDLPETASAGDAQVAPATGVRLGHQATFAIAPDRSVVVYDGTTLRRVRSGLPGTDLVTSIAVPSEDGREIYLFNGLGRHSETRDPFADPTKPRVKLSYSGNKLSSVTDEALNVTSIAIVNQKLSIKGPYQDDSLATSLSFFPSGYLQSIQNPLSHSVSATYATGAGQLGLLESWTDARGNKTKYSFDSLGRVNGVRDAVCDLTPSACLTLDRADGTGDAWTVTRKTPEGRSTTYGVARNDGGGESRSNMFPDGTDATSVEASSGARVTTLSDGTTVTETIAADPQYGLGAPVISRVTKTPGNVTRTETSTRSKDFNVSTGALAMQTDKVLVSGHLLPTETKFTATTVPAKVVTTSPAGRTRTLELDALGRVVKRSQPGVAPMDIMYDAKGRLEKVTQGARMRTWTYHPTVAGDGKSGYLSKITELITATTPRTTSFMPDALGRVRSEVDGNGLTTLLDWDENGNLTEVIPPKFSVAQAPKHEQLFTSVNLIEKYSPPPLPGDIIAVPTDYTYDLDRALTFVSRPDGRVLQQTYEQTTGRLKSVKEVLSPAPLTLLDHTYYAATCAGEPAGCAPGRLKSLTTNSGVTVTYGYDGLLTKSFSWSGAVAGTVSMTHDTAFRVASETVTVGSSSSTAFFGYDPDDVVCCVSATSACACGQSGGLGVAWNAATGFLEQIKLGDVTESFTYNAFGEVATQTATHTSPTPMLFEATYDDGATFARDLLGRITKKTETVLGGSSNAFRFVYDFGGRLTESHREIGVGGEALFQKLGYDFNGNRTSENHQVRTCASTAPTDIDNQDRLLMLTCSEPPGGPQYTVKFEYLLDGELKSKTDSRLVGPTTYEYDLRGNLRKVTLPSGDEIEYLVDGLDRRVAKKKNGIFVKRWLYRDRLRIVAELDGGGNLSRFVYGSRSNVPDYVVRGTKTYRIISDYLGSPRVVVNVNDASDVPLAITYEPFGAVLNVTGDPSFLPIGFAGGHYDPETGLVRFGARDYDPATGRWVSKDPIRFAGRSPNLYAYVDDDPVNNYDPDGTFVLFVAPVVAPTAAEVAVSIVGAAIIGGAIYNYSTGGSCLLRDVLTNDDKPANDNAEPAIEASGAGQKGPGGGTKKKGNCEFNGRSLREMNSGKLWCWYWCPNVQETVAKALPPEFTECPPNLGM